jgi:hypothetical protein
MDSRFLGTLGSPERCAYGDPWAALDFAQQTPRDALHLTVESIRREQQLDARRVGVQTAQAHLLDAVAEEAPAATLVDDVVELLVGRPRGPRVIRRSRGVKDLVDGDRCGGGS